MSLKSKFTSLILTFVLALGLLVVGVFALKTANFEVGGNIVYNVNGVQMTIEKMELNNLTVADEASKMQKVEVDNETTKAEMQTMFDTWKGLSLASTGEDGEVSIVIRITNIAPEENGKKIAVNVSVDVAEEGKNNCDVVVTNLNGETSTVIAPQQYADFKIAFVPEDDGFQGSINNFVVNFDILRATCSVVVNDEALGACSVVQSSEGTVFTATPTGTSTYVGLRNTATGKWADINTLGVEEFGANELLNSSAYLQDYFINNSSLRGNNELMDRIGGLLHDESAAAAKELADLESMIPGFTEVLTEIHNGNFTYQDSNANGEYEAVFTNSAQKQSIPFDECTYTIYPDAKVAVLTSTTKTGEVEILPTVTYGETTYDVIAVGGLFNESGAPTPVFTGDGITKVTLPNSITSVGMYTFVGCTNLTEVVLGDNVNSICYMAFAECSNLAKLTINTIKPCAQGSEYAYTEESISLGFPTTTEIHVPKEAYFDYVDAWSIYAGQIVAPEGVEVAALAYNYDDTNLTAEVKMLSPTATKGDIVVPETVKHNGQNYTVTAVADYGFYDEKQFLIDLLTGKVTDLSQISNYIAPITSITLPNTVTKIGEDAFEYNTSLMSVSIQNSVTYIGKYAFAYNSVLSSISIPDTIEYVGGEAFRDCTSLSKTTYDNIEYLGNTTNPYVLALDVDNSTSTSITIHENCKGIINNNGGAGLLASATVNLPDGLVFIGDSALYRFSNISKLPSNLKYLGESNFEYNSSISYTQYGNAYYLGNDANPYWVLMKATSTDITSVDIHQDCINIGWGAFSGCTSLSSVTIPDKVKIINESAFSGCSSATFTMGNSIEKIEDNAFNGCTNLSGQLDLRNANSIGTQAFLDCGNITSVILSNKLGSVGMSAFSGCTSFTDVYFMGTQKEYELSTFSFDATGLENATKHYNYNPN